MDKKPNKPAEVESDLPVMHKLETNSSFPVKTVAIFVGIALLGVITGYGLTSFQSSTGKRLIPVDVPNPALKGKTFGSNDTKTFKDTTEGVLKEGGIEGEGQYHLERPGGESQNVYLTSSIVDLSQFLGKKIKVWGQTQKAEHAGWLMDVGRVEIK